MTAYQAGIAKFTEADTQVYGISTDNTPSLKEFAAKVSASYPLLSDFATRGTAKNYGILIESAGVANRATFLVDMEGKIAHIEEGSAAINPEAALTACQRTKKK